MWKHCCAFVCAVAALLCNISTPVDTASDPSTLPRIQFNDLRYTGAFRLPRGMSNGDSFSIGGHPVAYNPAKNSLFIGSLSGNLAEVSIPNPVNSADVEALPFASYLQGFHEPTEGHLGQVGASDATVDGILVYGNRIYGTGSIFYDAQNIQRVSHFSRSTQLNQTSFSGWSSVWDASHSGFVSGFMALVPQEWQAALGGPAITGQCCIPIAWRTSWGPAAFAFNPVGIGTSAVTAHPLLYYTSEHQTLGHWSGSNPTYGATAAAKGVALIAGTRTVLYFGRNGLGPYCYGNGTNNQSLHGQMADNGAPWCYDPTSTDKGQHAYPYRYQIWAYDLNDLAAVKQGTKQPWDVVPYGVWPFELPMVEPSVKIGGVGYDSATQTIYLSQMRADKDVYSNRPIIHVLKVGGVTGSPLPVPSNDGPPPSSDPSPIPPARLSAVSVSASRPSPQAANTAITFTATPTGGISPHQYKWQQHDGMRWVAVTGWSTSNTYTWTPTRVGDYRFSVWVRNAGDNSDAAQASANANFTISGTASSPAPSPARVSSVGLSSNRAAPQAPGTAITFSALPSGGAAPLQFKWLIYNGSTWTASGSWTTSSSFTWTPTTANANYRVQVWARSAGNSADAAEAQVTMNYPVATATSTPPPTTTPSTRVTAVSISASLTAPQRPGTAIVLRATPVGGSGHQYKWQLHNGSSWSPISSWSTSNTFTWTPTAANSSYRLSVWVRNGGSTRDVADATANLNFPISASAPSTTTPPATSTPPPSTTPPPTTPPPTGATVSSVTLSSNRAAPQNRGTAIVWTATASGGTGPLQYRFSVSDGAGSVVARGWSTSNSFTWTPTIPNAYYRITVWVRSAGNTTDNYEKAFTTDIYRIR